MADLVACLKHDDAGRVVSDPISLRGSAQAQILPGSASASMNMVKPT